MFRLKIGILYDYQDVARSLADWSSLDADIEVFTTPFADADEVVKQLAALVGTDAFRFLARESVLVSQLTEQLKARREELPERVAALMTRLRDAERDLERLRSAQLLGAADGLARDAEDVGGVAFVAHRVPDAVAADGIRKLALDVRRAAARPAATGSRSRPASGRPPRSNEAAPAAVRLRLPAGVAQSVRAAES